MKLDLLIPWNSQDMETRRTTGFEFYGLRDTWNKHDAGVVFWNNMNAYNSIIGNLTVTGTVTNTGTLANLTPTIQKFTSGTGTYTLPTNPQTPSYIRVRMVGGGGGGSGSSTLAGANGGTGGTGGNTTFGTSLLTANGGVGGAWSASGAGGAGGTASIAGGAIGTAITGASGQGASINNANGDLAGAAGAGTPFAGPTFSAGNSGSSASGVVNSGTGGQSGGTQAVNSMSTGGGGGAGGFIDAIIATPSSTYSYAVGAVGSAGIAGTSGFAGGTGGSGYIEVTEYYAPNGAVLINTATYTTVNATNVNTTNLTATNETITNSTITTATITNATITNLVGTTTNNNASAGSVGEYGAAYANGVNAAASGAYTDMANISLSAGDWDVSLVFNLVANGATFTGVGTVFAGTTAGNNTTGLVLGDNAVNFLQPGAVATQTSGSIPNIRFSLAGGVTCYLKGQATYTVATPLWFARISARRVR